MRRTARALICTARNITGCLKNSGARRECSHAKKKPENRKAARHGAKKFWKSPIFSGLSRRSAETGSLLEAEGIRLLSEGTLASVLGRVQVSVPASTLQPGVYTLYDHYDSVYETQTTADFIYRNICPAEIMAYSDAEIIAARVLVGENLLPGKTADGYRNLLGAFADSSAFYIFYDAVVNIIDHRRADSYEAVGSGIVVQFESLKSTTSTYAYTVHQLWLDVITPGKGVTSQMIGAQRTQLFFGIGQPRTGDAGFGG